jgi:hypothetical protein
MNTKMAEPMGAVTTKWMKQMAHTGMSIIVETNKKSPQFIYLYYGEEI